MFHVVPWCGEKQIEPELQHVGAGRVANFEPFGKIIGQTVRGKEFLN